MPIVQGYVHIVELPVTFDDDDLDPVTLTLSDNGRHVLDDLKFKLCLISRRSRYRAGRLHNISVLSLFSAYYPRQFIACSGSWSDSITWTVLVSELSVAYVLHWK